MKYEVYYLLEAGMIMIKNENNEALFCEGTFVEFRDLCQDLRACNEEHKFYVKAAGGPTKLTYKV